MVRIGLKGQVGQNVRMTGASHHAIRAGLLAASLLLPPTAASAFELFGIRLWGEAEDEAGRIEIPDPLPYTVTIRARGADNARSIVEDASALWADRDEPAAGKAGLLAKGRGDYRRILTGFYNEGYFGASISIRAGAAEMADLTLGADIPQNVPVTIEVESGPEFRFGRADILNAPPLLQTEEYDFKGPDSVGFATGEPARTAPIGAAAGLAVEQWRRLARAKARQTDQEIVADHERDRLDVAVTLDPGPVVRYGPVSTEGSRRVDHDFIVYMADLTPGELYDSETIEEAKDRIDLLGTFSAVRFEESDQLGPDGSMPIRIVVEDRKPRTFGVGGTYSTLDGLGLQGYWLHRNLFGRAERLRFDASVEGLTQSGGWKDYDYNLGVSFNKPGVFNPDTSFITSLIARQLDYETYRETSITGRVGFQRQFTDYFSAELHAQVAKARYEDVFGEREFLTFGLDGLATYDSRDNDLDATRGVYLAATAEPFYEAEYGNTAVQTTLEGRSYLGFGEERDFVLAGRAKVGSFFGASVEQSPPDLLFFAGGGGSVRGYEYQSIGVPTLVDGEIEVAGGRSLGELSAEARYRFGSFGIVGFADAGFVAADPDFGGDTETKVGVGLGARYFTGFGPLRVDFAVPLDKEPGADGWGLYIGIGQAF
jgi:translocation and assembly module TamA